MSKLKDRWADVPRISKIAAAMYPGHLDQQTRKQMLDANPEVKEALQRRMSQSDRMYGRPQQPAPDLSKVPGLVPAKRR